MDIANKLFALRIVDRTTHEESEISSVDEFNPATHSCLVTMIWTQQQADLIRKETHFLYGLTATRLLNDGEKDTLIDLQSLLIDYLSESTERVIPD